MRRFAAAASCMLALAVPAGGAWAQAKVLTQPPAAAASDDRFIFQEVDEGILRLDTRTGEVSVCGRAAVGWVCRSAPDDRQAVDAEVGRLQTENEALRRQLAERSAESAKSGVTGTIPPADRKPAPGAAPPAATVPPAAPPEQRESRPALAAVDRLWRRLVEMMAELRADLQKKG